jgi:valyl-tRNA synthetase
MLEPYPNPTDFPLDPDAEQEIEWLKELVTAVRKRRAVADISPGQVFDVLLEAKDTRDLTLFPRYQKHLRRLAGPGVVSIVA